MVQGYCQGQVVERAAGRVGCLEETQVIQMEQTSKGAEIDKVELAKVMAELIKQDPKVRGAVMQAAYDTPGIMVEY